jgi:hypothetical protein
MSQDPLEFAVIGLSVLGSISVAVVVEWISLWGLMKMMPGPEPALESAPAPAEASAEAAPELATGSPAELQPIARHSTRQPTHPLASAATAH